MIFSTKKHTLKTHADHQPQVRPEAFCRGAAGSEGDVHRVFATVPARVARGICGVTWERQLRPPHGFTRAVIA